MKLQHVIFFVALLIASCALKTADDSISYISNTSSSSEYDLQPNEYNFPKQDWEIERAVHQTTRALHILYREEEMPGYVDTWIPAPELPFNTETKNYIILEYAASDGTVFHISKEAKRITYLPKDGKDFLKALRYK